MRKLILSGVILTTILGGFLSISDMALAQGWYEGVENAVEEANKNSTNNYGLGSVVPDDLKKTTDVSVMAGKVLGAILSLVGILFFGLMLYGGILWMTARGNEQQTSKAYDTIISAVIGLVIVLSSYVIVNFVFKTVGSGGSGSSATACSNPLSGLGRDCSTSPCDDLGSLVSCAPDPVSRCVSNSDSLCPQQCGSNFSCINKADCVDGTAVSNYCTGTASKVCCINK